MSTAHEFIRCRPLSTEGRVGDWIQCRSGVRFWPLDPRPEEIRIEDIAHALGMQCRFSGHVSEFLSVAEHSVMVALIVADLGGTPTDQLWGLLHDASEAYLTDVSKPLKAFMPQYEAAEAKLMRAIAVRFGLPLECPEIVKTADLMALRVEAERLMRPLESGWSKWLDGIPETHREIECFSWATAARVFRGTFFVLSLEAGNSGP